MNKVVLMGRLTRDPEVRYTQGDNSMAVAHYTLAVDRRRGRNNQQDGQPTADFISCVAFGKAAEHAERYYHKGIKICISGRIQTGSYTNKDGVKVYTTDVVVEEQEFAESRNGGQGGSASDYSSFNSYTGGNNYGGSSNSYGGNAGSTYTGNTGSNAASAGNTYPQPQPQPASAQPAPASQGMPGTGAQNQPAPAAAPQQPSGAIDGFMNIPDGIDEELPFN